MVRNIPYNVCMMSVKIHFKIELTRKNGIRDDILISVGSTNYTL